jgi:hypothetical protein
MTHEAPLYKLPGLDAVVYAAYVLHWPVPTTVVASSVLLATTYTNGEQSLWREKALLSLSKHTNP